jgi:hypothetical protein
MQLGTPTITSPPAIELKRKRGKGLIIIPESIPVIKERIKILKAAELEWHNNVKEELSALLDKLLLKKEINKIEYLNLVN